MLWDHILFFDKIYSRSRTVAVHSASPNMMQVPMPVHIVSVVMVARPLSTTRLRSLFLLALVHSSGPLAPHPLEPTTHYTVAAHADTSLSSFSSRSVPPRTANLRQDFRRADAPRKVRVLLGPKQHCPREPQRVDCKGPVDLTAPRDHQQRLAGQDDVIGRDGTAAF